MMNTKQKPTFDDVRVKAEGISVFLGLLTDYSIDAEIGDKAAHERIDSALMLLRDEMEQLVTLANNGCDMVDWSEYMS